MDTKFIVVNFDKKEFYSLEAASMEELLVQSPSNDFLVYKFMNDWKNERVGIISSIAEAKTSNVLNYDTLFLRFIELELGILQMDEDGEIYVTDDLIYNHVIENFTQIAIEEVKIGNNLYVYNPNKSLYIDMKKTPTLDAHIMVNDEDKIVDVEKIVMNPLFALLLSGWRNETGIFDSNDMHNRSWISDSSKIEILEHETNVLSGSQNSQVDLGFIHMNELASDLLFLYNDRLTALVEQNKEIANYSIGESLKDDLTKSVQNFLVG